MTRCEGVTASVDLTWTSADDNGFPLVGYEVAHALVGDPNGTLGDQIAGDRAEWEPVGVTRVASIGGLNPTAQHEFSVRAVNENGPGPHSSTVIATGECPGMPALEAVRAGTKRVRLEWAFPGFFDSVDETYELDVQVASADEDVVFDEALPPKPRLAVIKELENGVPYLVRLRLRNEWGASAWTDWVEFTPVKAGS